MFGFSFRFKNKQSDVDEAVEKAAFENLRHGVASMRKDAAKSIKGRRNKDIASPEGTPPFTHGGFIRRALRWVVGDGWALMGFRHSVVEEVGATHEFGLTEDGRDYPERPTLGPALERAAVRFHRDWRASVG